MQTVSTTVKKCSFFPLTPKILLIFWKMLAEEKAFFEEFLILVKRKVTQYLILSGLSKS